jgi:hypothetical protein
MKLKNRAGTDSTTNTFNEGRQEGARNRIIKILETIDACWRCPKAFAKGLKEPTGKWECGKTGKKIPDVDSIPEWCPLPDLKK